MAKRPPRTRQKTETSEPDPPLDLRLMVSLPAEFGGSPRDDAVAAAQDIQLDTNVTRQRGAMQL